MGYVINIRGRIREKSEIISYAKQVLDHFLGRQLGKSVSLDIEFKKQLFDDSGNPVGGLCWGDTDHVNIQVSMGVTVRQGPNKVYQSYPHDVIIELLTHELVHAKQYILGQVDNHSLSWRSEDMTLNCEEAMPSDEPWEKEAYCLEKPLKEIYWRGFKKTG
jgi:hypothetical protein